MDGTLIGSNDTISERNLSALRDARHAGIHIAIATGRRHSYAMKVLRGLDLPADTTLISSNGTVTRCITSQLIRRTLLPMENALWLCDHLRDYRTALVFTFDRVGHDGEDERGALVVEELDHLHNSIGAWMQANEPYILCSNPIETAIRAGGGNAPIQAMVCGTLEQMRAAEDALLGHEHIYVHGHSPAERIHTAHIAVHRTEYAHRDLCIVDLLPGGCSKGAALRDLCADLQTTPENVLAIGDNWNDLPLFETAGHRVVMGNAPAALQQLAQRRGWHLGPLHDEDGVAQAIESYLR
ncbi:MAG: HAD family phosphatase [Acidobacteria bacterium]|nr:HAD family phosphatase [Acidobacteriota bacterium]